MSVNNDVYKLGVGDLVERITWDAHAKKISLIWHFMLVSKTV